MMIDVNEFDLLIDSISQLMDCTQAVQLLSTISTTVLLESLPVPVRSVVEQEISLQRYKLNERKDRLTALRRKLILMRASQFGPRSQVDMRMESVQP